MEIVGEYRIAASRSRVWDALNDPEVLKQCIPGCKSLEQVSPESLKATVAAQLGPVRVNLVGTVNLSELDPPSRYKLSWEGSGGAAGFARGGAEVSLDDAGNETTLRYKALCTVGGKLAQIGSRLIDSTAKKLSDEFFGNFVRVLGTDAAQTPAPDLGIAPLPVAADGRANYSAPMYAALGLGAALLVYVVYRFIG